MTRPRHQGRAGVRGMAMVAVAAVLLLAAVPVYAQTAAPSELPTELPSELPSELPTELPTEVPSPPASEPASEPPSEPATPTLLTPEGDVTGQPVLVVTVDGNVSRLAVTLAPADPNASEATSWDEETSRRAGRSSVYLSLIEPPCPSGVQSPCALANGSYTLTVVADDAEEPVVEDQPIVLDVDPPDPPPLHARLRAGGGIKVSGQAVELPDSQPAELYRLGNPDELLDTFEPDELITFLDTGPEGARLEPGIYSYRLQVTRAGARGTPRTAEATSIPLEVVAPDPEPDPEPTPDPDPTEPSEPVDPIDPTEPVDPVDPTESVAPTEPSEPDPKPDRSTNNPTDDGGLEQDDSDGDDREVVVNTNDVGSAGSLTSPFTRSSLALSAPGPGVSTGLASQNLPEIAPPAIAAPQVAVPEIPAPAPLPLAALPAPAAPAVAPAVQAPATLQSLLGILPQPLATSPVLIASRTASPDLPSSVPVALWALLAGALGWRLVLSVKHAS